MLVRSLGLGEIKDKRPELFPRFFEVDLAPCILEFLCRNDGGCYKLTEGADCLRSYAAQCLSGFHSSCLFYWLWRACHSWSIASGKSPSMLLQVR